MGVPRSKHSGAQLPPSLPASSGFNRDQGRSQVRPTVLERFLLRVQLAFDFTEKQRGRFGVCPFFPLTERILHSRSSCMLPPWPASLVPIPIPPGTFFPIVPTTAFNCRFPLLPTNLHCNGFSLIYRLELICKTLYFYRSLQSQGDS